MFDKTLVLAGTKPKRIRFRILEDTTLEQTTWNARGAPKVTTRSFGERGAAVAAFHDAVRKKLRADYAYIAEPRVFGDVILEAFAPGAGSGHILDLSLDGRFVATATTTGRGSGFGMKIEIVEVATGARHVVCEEPSNGRQNFVHTVLFDRDATGIYFQRNDHTEHVHIQTGDRHTIAISSGFNSHVVHPSFDRERRRLVVPSQDWTIVVLDESRTALVEVPTHKPDVECRAAAISPSGRLLAVYLVHRSVTSSHDPIPDDVACEVQIWDIEARVPWETVRLRHALDGLGFTPEDDALVVTYYYAAGPIALDIPSGNERWRFDDPEKPGTLARANDWAFSPTGDLIAIAGDGLHVHDAKTRAEIELPGRTWRGDCVRFSRDGKRLAIVSGGTATVLAL